MNNEISENDMGKSSFLNLHEESLYLRGARDMLLRIQDCQGEITIIRGREGKIYNDAIFKEVLYNRESLVKFLQGTGWSYKDHQQNKKGKLVSVKVEFNKD